MAQKVRQLSLFDQNTPAVERHRRRHNRVRRAKGDNLKAFNAFLIDYKMQIDNGRRPVVKTLQNKYHVGHFPKSYIPVKDLRNMTLQKVDDSFSRKIYREIQDYNKNANRKGTPSVSYSNKEVSAQEKKDMKLISMIDSAISELEQMRTFFRQQFFNN